MYSGLSLVYDRLMADADYPKRTAELLRLFEKYDRCTRIYWDLWQAGHTLDTLIVET